MTYGPFQRKSEVFHGQVYSFDGSVKPPRIGALETLNWGTVSNDTDPTPDGPPTTESIGLVFQSDRGDAVASGFAEMKMAGKRIDLTSYSDSGDGTTGNDVSGGITISDTIGLLVYGIRATTGNSASLTLQSVGTGVGTTKATAFLGGDSIDIQSTDLTLWGDVQLFKTLTVGRTGFPANTTMNGDLHVTGNLTVDGTGGGGGGSSVPTGAMMMWHTATAPTGWALCNGSSQLRTGTYAALFAVIGTMYGAVDGTHFNLPPMNAVVPVGYKSGDANFGTLGGAAGALGSAHTHTEGAHTHTSAAHTHTSAAHTHTLSSAGQAKMTITTGGLIVTRSIATTNFAETNRYSMTGTNGTPASSSGTGIGLAGSSDSTTPAATGSTTPGATGSSAGTGTGSTASSTLQPSITVNYIIKL